MAQPPKANDPQPIARRNRVGPVGGDIREAASTAFAHKGFADPTLVLRWAEIAGPETARLARPMKLTDGPSGGTLTLMAEPGAALFLQHESRALTERINRFLGRPAVARLRFVHGTLTVKTAPKHRPALAAPPGPNDPANRYNGPDSVKTALLKLAAKRGARTFEREP